MSKSKIAMDERNLQDGEPHTMSAIETLRILVFLFIFKVQLNSYKTEHTRWNFDNSSNPIRSTLLKTYSARTPPTWQDGIKQTSSSTEELHLR